MCADKVYLPLSTVEDVGEENTFRALTSKTGLIHFCNVAAQCTTGIVQIKCQIWKKEHNTREKLEMEVKTGNPWPMGLKAAFAVSRT